MPQQSQEGIIRFLIGALFFVPVTCSSEYIRLITSIDSGNSMTRRYLPTSYNPILETLLDHPTAGPASCISTNPRHSNEMGPLLRPRPLGQMPSVAPRLRML